MIIYYATYYILDITMGVISWTGNNIYNSFQYLINGRDKRNNAEFLLIENTEELKKEIKELRQLILNKI